MKTNSKSLASLRLCVSLLLLGSFPFLAGCTSTSYRDQSGAEFSRVSFFTKQNIGKVELKAGDKQLSIEGYSNEQTEIAAAVASSVAKALTPAK